MPLIAEGLTDIGRKRKTNQDAIYINREKHYFIVADGMGGYNGGDIASKTAVEYAPQYLFGESGGEVVENLKRAVLSVGRKIRETAQKDERLKGMGTTFNALFFQGSKLYVTNVGDSRTYLINRGLIYQLSSDHSLVQEKVNLDIYTREEAAKDPRRNILTRAIGIDEGVEVDVYSYTVSRYDIFLSCSDGLYGKVSDSDILHIVNTHIRGDCDAREEVLKACVKELIDQANANGGSDNISALLVMAV